MACVPLCYLLIFGEGGYLRLRHYQEELQELQVQNMKLKRQQQGWMQKIKNLKDDPAEIERFARERHNFARPGDVIVNVPQSR